MIRDIIKIVYMLIFFLLGGFACRDQGVEPPIDINKIKLTLIDASVREVYLHIHVAYPSNSETITIMRNGVIARSFSTAITDTVFADTGLTANTIYSYQALIQVNGKIFVKSNPINVQTLQPTSHDFIWQTFQIGDGNSSFLQDIFILNDTLAYAVGEIYVKDSMGEFLIDPYNALNWDGEKWNKLRIPFILNYGTSIFIDSTISISSVYALGMNDIWFNNGGVTRLVNNSFQMMNFLLTEGPGRANKIWGTSANSMYFVANSGRLTLYNGSVWLGLESGTTTDINDVWGVINPISNKQEVYCAVSDSWEVKDRKILKITDTDHVDSVYWGMGRDIMSVWTNKGFPLYACGGGLFENSQGFWKEINLGNNNDKNRIRGNGLNDIFVVDPFGIIAHYNGVDWRIVSTISNGGYISVYVKNDMVVAVGSGLGRGIVTIGKRN